MKMKRIDPLCLRVEVTEEELKEHQLSFEDIDTDRLETKLFLSILLEKARQQESFSPGDGQLIAQIYQCPGGCIFYFINIPKEGKENNESTPLIFTFPDCNAMLTALTTLFQHGCHRIYKSSLYQMEGTYYFAFQPFSFEDSVLLGMLQEYRQFWGKGNIKQAQLEEHGQVIVKENALDKIAYFLA